MHNQIYRSINEPIRQRLSWNEKWRGEDKGLIFCWENGRALREIDTKLAERAEKGELPVLGWKGGVNKRIIKSMKFGTYNYLAKWQGLRGEDLSINLTEEVELVCSNTEMRVIYTSDQKKHENA